MGTLRGFEQSTPLSDLHSKKVPLAAGSGGSVRGSGTPRRHAPGQGGLGEREWRRAGSKHTVGLTGLGSRWLLGVRESQGQPGMCTVER